MGAVSNSLPILVRSFSSYEYRWAGWLNPVQERREVPTRVYEQPWVKDTSPSAIGSPGGDFLIYRTDYTVARDGIHGKVTSEWRDDTEAWTAV